MKNNFCFIPLILCLFNSCKSVPLNEKLEDFPPKQDFSSDDKLLNIYFPTFVNEKKEVIGGDGIVIVFPDNSTMIIDGFYKEAGEQFVEYLKNLGITKIDYLVVSHFHSDHIGSFELLLDNFEVGILYTNGGHINSECSRNFVQKIQKIGVEENVLQEGDELTVGECNIKVYSPKLSEKDLYNLYYHPGKTAKLINNSSLVFKLTFSDFSILFTGDVYKKQDKYISKMYKSEIKSTLIKVPHHADKYTASSKKFISTVHADYGLICDNRYVGQIIYQRYKKKGTKLLCKNTEGQIQITTNGEIYSISSN